MFFVPLSVLLSAIASTQLAAGEFLPPLLFPHARTVGGRFPHATGAGAPLKPVQQDHSEAVVFSRDIDYDGATWGEAGATGPGLLLHRAMSPSLFSLLFVSSARTIW